MSASEPIVVPGTSALVLVAPHGGRRDYDHRPWGSAALKVNDLHTAALTEELAAATNAAAVINADLDRNDVDLNRLSAAHEGAPAFLERLADVLSSTLARHGRATVLTVHGWNVIQPAVDLGYGCKPGESVDGAASVSTAFAARAVPALARACAARGIAATVAARYPARGRENLVQLFTARYRDDPRPLVRALAGLGSRTDALQLELGVPLRWPGAWRGRLLAACVEALPALIDPGGTVSVGPTPPPPGPAPPARHALEIVGRDTAALVAVDATGARLLVFPPAGGLVMFTGERTGGAVEGLQVEPAADGALAIRFAGPMMRFPDTTPFLDLERGLGAASVVEHARVDLRFEPAHAGPPGSDFGLVCGSARFDGEHLDVGGHAFGGAGPGAAVWPRLRIAVALAPDARLALTVGLSDGTASGFLCQAGRHRGVSRAHVRLGPTGDPLAGIVLDVELEGGEHVPVRPETVHRLPVVRGGSPAPLRLVYASCRVAGVPGLAGWCELGGA